MTRYGRQERRPDPPTTQDLEQWRALFRRASVSSSLCQQGTDALGIRTYVQDHDQPEQHKPGRNEPWHREVALVRPFAGEERGEYQWAHECAEDGAEQNKRYASAPALGRIHIGRCGTREHNRTCRGPDQDEAPDYRHHREQQRPESGKRATQDPTTETSREHRNSAEAIHSSSRRKSGEGRGAKEYGRAKTGEPFKASHSSERYRSHRHRELVHRVERRHADREQQRVASYRML